MNAFSSRRGVLCLAAAAASASTTALLPHAVFAAGFPDRPLKFIVPFNPGGNVDSVGRLLAAALGPLLRQPVVVDNRSGAGGSLVANLVVQSPPDGYTLMVGSNGPLTINPFVLAKLQYKPLEDLAPVALVGTVPHVLIANNSLAAKSLQELIALSKKESLGCASSGVGSATHLTLARFSAQTGARMKHVPYRGGNSLVPDLLGGAVQLASMELSTALPLHVGGKARILGVAASRRSPLAPDVPTFIEGGVAGFTAQSYVGLLAPVRTPPSILAQLESASMAAIGSPEMAARLKSIGMQVAEPADRTAAGFAKLLKTDYAATREAVRIANIQPE